MKETFKKVLWVLQELCSFQQSPVNQSMAKLFYKVYFKYHLLWETFPYAS